MSSLPTPRQLLTSLLNAISEIPAPAPTPAPAPEHHTHTHAASTASNPLKAIGPAHRPLFTTLHVLFPSLLLPALDLLDRGLVTRLTRVAATTTAAAAAAVAAAGGGGGGGAAAAAAHGQVRGCDSGERDIALTDYDAPTTTITTTSITTSTTNAPSLSQIYQVRSAQKSTSSRRPFHRRGGGGGGGGGGESDAAAGSGSSGSGQKSYIVHTAAWNCTCAAFVFAAFPPLAPSALGMRRDDAGGGSSAETQERKKEQVDEEEEEEEEEDEDEEEDGEEGRRWSFGGFSLDGVDDDGRGVVPPCCKHLLACILAERWDAVLGRYVNERKMRREEMAGVFADI